MFLIYINSIFTRSVDLRTPYGPPASTDLNAHRALCIVCSTEQLLTSPGWRGRKTSFPSMGLNFSLTVHLHYKQDFHRQKGCFPSPPPWLDVSSCSGTQPLHNTLCAMTSVKMRTRLPNRASMPYGGPHFYGPGKENVKQHEEK